MALEQEQMHTQKSKHFTMMYGEIVRNSSFNHIPFDKDIQGESDKQAEVMKTADCVKKLLNLSKRQPNFSVRFLQNAMIRE